MWFKGDAVANKDDSGLLSSRDYLTVSGSFLSMWNWAVGFVLLFLLSPGGICTYQQKGFKAVEIKRMSCIVSGCIVMFSFWHFIAKLLSFPWLCQHFCSSTPHPVIPIWSFWACFCKNPAMLPCLIPLPSAVGLLNCADADKTAAHFCSSW